MTDGEDHMVKISALISRLQSTMDQFGDTCVYIRRGGLSWGAVALNRRSDDQKHGVFDLHAQHDRDMLQRLEQIERLKASRNAAEARITEAVAEERERCAKIADDTAKYLVGVGSKEFSAAVSVATAIRGPVGGARNG
ncbi:hypothetical protein SAMN05444159_1323 [Bradyrhizobium lablabi]|uniref:Uncharacterized protein n=1 Tax=Bradyrhizobium lablabi TaxID=722472 RepID=A0A1M6LMC3_9BRAD|nr:hypothetical protein [Bradyrhizobium lablabi]SHJ72347.1 hypothetical protein SAMN05444159_1323 [Bradyrhizobium lablabi]